MRCDAARAQRASGTEFSSAVMLDDGVAESPFAPHVPLCEPLQHPSLVVSESGLQGC